MDKKFAVRLPVCAVLAAISSPLWAETTTTLDEVVVTAPRMEEPLTVVTDPKAPQQPVPANDGASYLKNIPGFTVIRKGGTDGDPVLRGLAGSRLNILLDGADFLGGCGMRMDPPTAYVFPETFDEVTVIKGPQTVLYGNGNSAGVVLFDRDPMKLVEPGAHAFASLLAGSWERLDGVLGGNYATDKVYVHAIASYAQSDDYEDGDGKEVHSFYERKSITGVAGWTPDKDTRLEFSAVASEAEAAYADRGMDGVIFDRNAYGLKFEKANLGNVLQKIKAQVNYNYIDHVMDNYSLRTNTSGTFSVNNPDRKTKSARVSGDLDLAPTTLLTVGTDWQANDHTLRALSASSAALADLYVNLPRRLDMETDIKGIFSELRHEFSAKGRLIGGLRLDDWSATRYVYSMTMPTTVTAFAADETLTSAFLRYERDLASQPATLFVGLGHSQRPMDYWEASTYNGLDSTPLSPEKNTQLDAGVIWKTATLSTSLSVFYSKINDYILTYASMLQGPCPVGTMNPMSKMWQCSFNVDATRYGGEADLAWRFAPRWTLRGTLAYVHGDNDSRDVPLAQTPPLEGRLGLDYGTGPWTFGGVLRMVAEQDRVDPMYGNIVGQDFGPTDGFTTLSLNAAYKPNKQLLIAAGVDNVFDETYHEHLARDMTFGGDTVLTTRVNEPGRFFWAKVNYQF